MRASRSSRSPLPCTHSRQKCVRCWIKPRSPRRLPCLLEQESDPKRECFGIESRASVRNGSTCIYRCVTGKWANKDGGKERRRISVAPGFSSTRRKSCSRTLNWKSTWCCRRKLPGSVPRRLYAAREGLVSAPSLAAKILQYHFQHGARVSEA